MELLESKDNKNKEIAVIEILNEIKTREDDGYAYDRAQASFELLARKHLGKMPKFFEIKRYKVTVERRKNKYNKMVSISEAVVVTQIGDKKVLSVSESLDSSGSDRGPAHGLLGRGLPGASAHKSPVNVSFCSQVAATLCACC